MVNMLVNMCEVLLAELAGVAVVAGALYLYWKAMSRKSN